MGKKELVGVALLGGGYGLLAVGIALHFGQQAGGSVGVTVAVLVAAGVVGMAVAWWTVRRAPDVGVSWAELDAELYRLLDQWRAWADTMEERSHAARGHIAGSGTVRSAIARAHEARACANDLEGVLGVVKGASRD